MDTYICSESVKTCMRRINTKCRMMVMFMEWGRKGRKEWNPVGLTGSFNYSSFFKSSEGLIIITYYN